MNLLQTKEIEEIAQKTIVELDNLQISLSGKLKTLDKKKQIFKILMKIFEFLNKILHFFIEQKIQVSHEPDFIENISLYLSILLMISFKHPSKYRIPLLQSLTKLIDLGVDPVKTPLYEILYDQAYLYEKMEANIPANKLLIESLAAIEFLMDYNIFYLRIIDPSGLFKKFIFEKYNKKGIFIESWTRNKETEANIEKALITGGLLIIEEWDEGLFKLIEPVLEWKMRIINKEISKFFVKKQGNDNNSYVNNIPDEGIRRSSSIVNTALLDNVVNYAGKELNIHKKFKLCLLLRNERNNQSKELKTKVFMLKLLKFHFFYKDLNRKS